MAIQFFLLVNKQGQTRLAQYLNFRSIEERIALEGEVVRKCLQRKESECNFVEHLNYKLVYRRYASLFFIVGLDGGTGGGTITSAAAGASGRGDGSACDDAGSGGAAPLWCTSASAGGFDARKEVTLENELAVLEFIHLVVEALDKYFENVCELDVMFNMEKAHFILEEMMVNGAVGDTNKSNALQQVILMDREQR